MLKQLFGSLFAVFKKEEPKPEAPPLAVNFDTLYVQGKQPSLTSKANDLIGYWVNKCSPIETADAVFVVADYNKVGRSQCIVLGRFVYRNGTIASEILLEREALQSIFIKLA